MREIQSFVKFYIAMFIGQIFPPEIYRMILHKIPCIKRGLVLEEL